MQAAESPGFPVTGYGVKRAGVQQPPAFLRFPPASWPLLQPESPVIVQRWEKMLVLYKFYFSFQELQRGEFEVKGKSDSLCFQATEADCP